MTNFGNLPREIQLKIMKEEAIRIRLDWWYSLDELQQEYVEWPYGDNEYAEMLLDEILREFSEWTYGDEILI
jgi:hypothetical protein